MVVQRDARVLVLSLLALTVIASGCTKLVVITLPEATRDAIEQGKQRVELNATFVRRVKGSGSSEAQLVTVRQAYDAYLEKHDAWRKELRGAIKENADVAESPSYKTASDELADAEGTFQVAAHSALNRPPPESYFDWVVQGVEILFEFTMKVKRNGYAKHVYDELKAPGWSEIAYQL